MSMPLKQLKKTNHENIGRATWLLFATCQPLRGYTSTNTSARTTPPAAQALTTSLLGTGRETDLHSLLVAPAFARTPNDYRLRTCRVGSDRCYRIDQLAPKLPFFWHPGKVDNPQEMDVVTGVREASELEHISRNLVLGSRGGTDFSHGSGRQIPRIEKRRIANLLRYIIPSLPPPKTCRPNQFIHRNQLGSNRNIIGSPTT
jgi:hypothetical protein